MFLIFGEQTSNKQKQVLKTKPPWQVAWLCIDHFLFLTYGEMLFLMLTTQ